MSESGTWEKTCVYKSTLRDVYGLTPKMIEELGRPDDYTENPHWKRGHPASLYRIERVEAWVAANKERVEKAKANRAKRSAALQAAKEALQAAEEEQRLERLRQLKEWVETTPFKLERPLPATLLDDGRKFCQFPPKGDPFDSNALRAHIRTNYTDYYSIRYKLDRDERRSELGKRLRSRVDEFINGLIADWKKQHPDIVASESTARTTETAESAAA